ncbi:unnamed protein product [Ilex paraguariensis]|uniref:Uncharacterized protein n=1 Tax=Ilex paraguariensis TaxID=185542 RepID=A0ABC8R3G3_9AQUA
MDKNSEATTNVKNAGKNKPVTIVASPKIVLNGEREKNDESESLLPSRRGGLSKKLANPRRKVQWNDKNGDKLVEVLEYQPSDVSDSDDEDSDSCICTIM